MLYGRPDLSSLDLSHIQKKYNKSLCANKELYYSIINKVVMNFKLNAYFLIAILLLFNASIKLN